VEGKWNFELVRRSQCPPWGLWGGKPGDYGVYLLRTSDEHEFCPMAGAHHPVEVNSEVIVRTGGGGGWGDPLERDPSAVRADVQEEFISPRSARDDYGVALRADLSIDAPATAQLRDALRSAGVALGAGPQGGSGGRRT
jgi:N-methylhydantoinase B